MGGAEPCGRGAAEKGEPEPKAEKSEERRRAKGGVGFLLLLSFVVFGVWFS